MLVGLTAAWQASSPAVRRNKGRFEKFWNSLLIAFTVFYEGSVIVVLPPIYFSRFFRVKHIVRRVVESRKSGMPCFFVSIPIIKYYRTLLILQLSLSTVILNSRDQQGKLWLPKSVPRKTTL